MSRRAGVAFDGMCLGVRKCGRKRVSLLEYKAPAVFHSCTQAVVERSWCGRLSEGRTCM